MYLNFHNFKFEPFNITPDPRFLYLSPGHKEALAAVMYGVEQRKGFITITGEVGVGKTTIIRSFLERIDRNKLRVIYLFNANLGFKELLRCILRELDIVTNGEETFAMVNQLHDFLIKQYAQSGNVVVIIDEAQNMPVETLENLRMLSNLETSEDKLIQIVFSAQREFDKLLGLNELRQLKQRIAVKATIPPLTAKESLEYIHHRLSLALAKDSAIFSQAALRRIVDHSNGVPRVINILCDNCLITAYGHQKQVVTVRIVNEIIRDFSGKKRRFWEWRAFQFAVLLTVITLIFATFYFSVLPQALKDRNGAKPTISKSSMPAQTVQLPPSLVSEAVAVPTPEKLSKTSISSKEASTIVRTVRKGDTLANLILETYGYADKSIINKVRETNPTLKNINHIVEGTVLYFPVKKKQVIASGTARGEKQ